MKKKEQKTAIFCVFYFQSLCTQYFNSFCGYLAKTYIPQPHVNAFPAAKLESDSRKRFSEYQVLVSEKIESFKDNMLDQYLARIQRERGGKAKFCTQNRPGYYAGTRGVMI